MANTALNAPASMSLFARLGAALHGLVSGWSRQSDYRRTYRELSRLTNRELADIGVRRCDIEDIARLHVPGR